ncbi:hypothetical protein [Hyphomicrobium sp. DY-1]|uniref:hypothetical protein n=1 Tax=Hyphomicrobium sp. DY-1 TaxID=3075650 RepID=UPI0039C2EF39
MQRKYPRTAEDREAIAAARRKLYASQKPEEVMVVPDPVDDEPKKDVEPRAVTKIDEPVKEPAPVKDILPTEANKLAAAHATVPAKDDASAADVEIPDNYETLGWKHLRALVGKLSKTPVVNREQAVHIIAEELQRRAKAAKK